MLNNTKIGVRLVLLVSVLLVMLVLIGVIGLRAMGKKQYIAAVVLPEPA
ncbi:MAG: hypothetical protein ACYC05_07565 [Sulfuricella sp.]